ncbi:CoA transferase [Aestuariicella hydrocarbonica]|uniref:CoA transferase n=1 Tax=Pseudomaricurvus hydrocarbonicus TaxID=1470433 RepID=A0A9E5JVH9_9GAMM|nr:CaiB/BaiF CoA-transferase family protein [Aestuariicella hydrocarbonica]NHO65650.1 CoA transferase [Aestuariicella hydrocarbonica]
MHVLKPLTGLRILDFTAMPPGGACTVMLADLGAEVIRVEPPASKGKPSLVIGQMGLSRGKRSMTLNMRNQASIDVLTRLAPTIDVVVENAKPGAMEARGFGYPQCSAINSHIIWCAITGFGQTGPYAEHAGHDLSYIAHSGLLGAMSDQLPWQPGIALALQAGAQTAVASILAAVIERGRSGKGAFIDLSLSEAATWLLNCGINPLSKTPLFLQATADRRLYQCADNRFVAVACAEPRTWNILCDELKVPECKALLHQQEHQQQITRTLTEIFRTRTAPEWVEQLAPKGAAVTILNHGSELLDDPQVRSRQSVVETAGVPVPASPIRISTSDGAHTTTNTEVAHITGDDTVAILRSAGFTSTEIESLTSDAII